MPVTSVARTVKTAPRTIEATHAIISTASVELRTITINNKQMTLAVFRQLPEEQLLSPKTGELRGVAWGPVNYCPDRSCEGDTHIHVVWQQGSVLKRSTIQKTGYDQPSYQERAGIVRDLLSCAILKSIVTGASVLEVARGSYGGPCYVIKGGIPAKIYESRQAV